MKNRLLAPMSLAVLTGVLLFAMCNLLNNSTEGDKKSDAATVTSGATLMVAGTYQATAVEGGKTALIITTTTAETIDTVKWCDDSVLVTELDTTAAQTETDTTGYELNGNTLNILDDKARTLGTALIEEIITFKRKGSGTGLEGVWQFDSWWYRVISGTLDASDKAELDSMMVDNNKSYGAMGMEMLLTSKEIKIYTSANMASWVIKAFMEEIEDGMLDDTCLDISIATVSETSVKITGKKSAEIVTITFNPSSKKNMTAVPEVDITYSSSKAGHATYTYYANPTRCPNDMLPYWWMDFVMENYNSECMDWLSKRSALMPSFARHRMPRPSIRLFIGTKPE